MVRTPGRQLLVAVYAVFAVSAGARSAVQLATKYDEAPVAYLLSALAAVIYVVATVALRYQGRRATVVALSAISIELVGVLGVGVLSIIDPDLFPEATVWSDFGVGYGFIPLLLPIIGLWWLWKYGARATTSA